jgi:hypothetical protein
MSFSDKNFVIDAGITRIRPGIHNVKIKEITHGVSSSNLDFVEIVVDKVDEKGVPSGLEGSQRFYFGANVINKQTGLTQTGLSEKNIGHLMSKLFDTDEECIKVLQSEVDEASVPRIAASLNRIAKKADKVISMMFTAQLNKSNNKVYTTFFKYIPFAQRTTENILIYDESKNDKPVELAAANPSAKPPVDDLPFA